VEIIVIAVALLTAVLIFIGAALPELRDNCAKCRNFRITPAGCSEPVFGQEIAWFVNAGNGYRRPG
jgi:hypothetical protein